MTEEDNDQGATGITPSWESESGKYAGRLRALITSFPAQPPVDWEGTIVKGMTSGFTRIQYPVNRAMSFIRTGCYLRLFEILTCVRSLWTEGHLAFVPMPVRLSYEIWAVTRKLRIILDEFSAGGSLEKFEDDVNKVFEGVRVESTEVLLPWGAAASSRAFHLLDLLRDLEKEKGGILQIYERLSEACHANLPRYQEWQIVGRLINNWSNPTAYKMGHKLFEQTISALERSIDGATREMTAGLTLAEQIWKESEEKDLKILDKPEGPASPSPK